MTDESAPIIVCIPDVDNEDSDAEEEDITVSAAMLLQPTRSRSVARSTDSIAVIFFIVFPFRNNSNSPKIEHLRRYTTQYLLCGYMTQDRITKGFVRL